MIDVALCVCVCVCVATSQRLCVTCIVMVCAQEAVFKLWDSLDELRLALAEALNKLTGITEDDPREIQGYNLPLSYCMCGCLTPVPTHTRTHGFIYSMFDVICFTNT
jgi:hypothetical protein